MIINLTQHQETAEQIDQGVFTPSLPCGTDFRAQVSRLLTFPNLPTSGDLADACNGLQAICRTVRSEYPTATKVMIGGAPWLMPLLEISLRNAGFRVLYAFSVRQSVDQVQEDGSIRKVAVFRHTGFVETPNTLIPLVQLITKTP